jgi:hypothetical protein
MPNQCCSGPATRLAASLGATLGCALVDGLCDFGANAQHLGHGASEPRESLPQHPEPPGLGKFPLHRITVFPGKYASFAPFSPHCAQPRLRLFPREPAAELVRSAASRFVGS